jgi:hypothetical protein
MPLLQVFTKPLNPTLLLDGCNKETLFLQRKGYIP